MIWYIKQSQNFDLMYHGPYDTLCQAQQMMKSQFKNTGSDKFEIISTEYLY